MENHDLRVMSEEALREREREKQLDRASETQTFICNMCGSEFPVEERVIDEAEGEVCKGCYEDQDKCRGGHVYERALK